jgi:MFS-type transporter involved in bile tolerance (Atg22 family)
MKEPRVPTISRFIYTMSKKSIAKEHISERTPLLREESSWSTQTLVSSSGPKACADSPYLVNITTFEFWLIFGAILAQYFVAMFDSFLMVSSHPIITSYFNASNSASWLSTAFMLTSAALQPIFGRMSDMFGRRSVYMSSLLIFAVGTGYCAAARNIGEFVAGRAICGVGAGAMISMVSSGYASNWTDIADISRVILSSMT